MDKNNWPWINTTDSSLQVLHTLHINLSDNVCYFYVYITNFRCIKMNFLLMNNPFSSILKLEWCGGEEEIKRLRQKVILEGSRGRKYLVIL